MGINLQPESQRHTLERAYQHCQTIASGHYENFPVASVLIPSAIRPAVAALYAFARTADDIADEGSATAAERHTQLNNYQTQLLASHQGAPTHDPILVALTDTMQRYSLPLQLLLDLLSAFRQDIDSPHYPSAESLLDYCRRSAHPIGRLMLLLFQQATPIHNQWSDAICSALQLLNFVQDIGQDMDENRRIYLPQDEMDRCGVTPTDIQQRHNLAAIERLIQLQLDRIETMLNSGSPLGWQLPGRFGVEIRTITLAAWHLLHRLRPPQDRFQRPRIQRLELIVIAFRALMRRPYPQ